ncbi:MAG: diaminopimelate decarboxylase, partial [Dehalococcoidia bacterium]
MVQEQTHALGRSQEILPLTASLSEKGHLTLGGCDCVKLAHEFGTPLYVFDEATLHQQCQQFLGAFRSRQRQAQVQYAAKAYLGRALAALLAEEGLGLDVVSGGELAVARSVGFPPERIVFHGNNKSAQELQEALAYGVGRIAVDNFHELSLLSDVAAAMGRRQEVLLRLAPGIDPHTHHHTTTGTVDSKFGIAMADGQAERAVKQALDLPALALVGLHVHLGSPIFELEPYRLASSVVVAFAAEMRRRYGFEMREYSPGGGFAVQYVAEEPASPVAAYAEAIFSSLAEACQQHSLPLPRVAVEPGRSIVGRAGVALYSVGSRKEVPGVRTYVAVDGGMADNIRPAIYSSRYTAVVASKAAAPAEERVTIAGRYCESGDILARDVDLPRLEPGDIVALLASGAYCLAMASNYNASLRPAIVMVGQGEARLVRRRESYEDLMRCDV